MEYLEFEKLFIENYKENNINKDEINNLYKYMKLLLEWNEKINVTAITDEGQFLKKHILDSLTINGFLKDEYKIIDIGTGGGIPRNPIKNL